jgi:hypothetical protein
MMTTTTNDGGDDDGNDFVVMSLTLQKYSITFFFPVILWDTQNMIWFCLTDKSSNLYPDTFLLDSTVYTVELIKPDKNMSEANVEKHRGGALHSVALDLQAYVCKNHLLSLFNILFNRFFPSLNSLPAYIFYNVLHLYYPSQMHCSLPR